jgi:hypothetical protein
MTMIIKLIWVHLCHKNIASVFLTNQETNLKMCGMLAMPRNLKNIFTNKYRL